MGLSLYLSISLQHFALTGLFDDDMYLKAQLDHGHPSDFIAGEMVDVTSNGVPWVSACNVGSRSSSTCCLWTSKDEQGMQ